MKVKDIYPLILGDFSIRKSGTAEEAFNNRIDKKVWKKDQTQALKEWMSRLSHGVPEEILDKDVVYINSLPDNTIEVVYAE